jgi:cytidine deaminase
MTGSERQSLIDAACRAREQAYAPYSHFRVGAALLAADGRVFTGVNIENASYGLTVCAERNAVGRMVVDGGRRIAAVAVCTDNGVTPCGACRQVLAEFAPADGELAVILIDGRGNVRETTLAALLPEQFGPEHLR